MEVVEESRVFDNTATFVDRRCFLIFFTVVSRVMYDSMT